MFIVAVVMMCTGFIMYAPTSTWFFPKMFTWVTPLFGGDELKVRMVHHILMWHLSYLLEYIFICTFPRLVRRSGIFLQW